MPLNQGRLIFEIYHFHSLQNNKARHKTEITLLLSHLKN